MSLPERRELCDLLRERLRVLLRELLRASLRERSGERSLECSGDLPRERRWRGETRREELRDRLVERLRVGVLPPSVEFPLSSFSDFSSSLASFAEAAFLARLKGAFFPPAGALRFPDAFFSLLLPLRVGDGVFAAARESA